MGQLWEDMTRLWIVREGEWQGLCRAVLCSVFFCTRV